MRLSRLAPAKVNLYLHVGRVQADGFHPISSLMAFADIGDKLSIAAADHLSFEVTGPFAQALEGESAADNLVVKAARALLQEVRGPTPPVRLILDKVLPVAAGLGGGSSDAGAALKLMRDAMGLSVSDETLSQIAASLGADGAACFAAAPCVAEGRGERLSPPPLFPPLDAVLVNPGAACPTGAVYRAYDAAPSGDEHAPDLPPRLDDAQEAAAFLSYCRNDLEAPAIRMVPEVGAALDLLRGEPETLLARMSGSGATCFALCESDIEAEGLAERLRRFEPGWWIKRCRLGGPWD